MAFTMSIWSIRENIRLGNDGGGAPPPEGTRRGVEDAARKARNHPATYEPAAEIRHPVGRARAEYAVWLAAPSHPRFPAIIRNPSVLLLMKRPQRLDQTTEARSTARCSRSPRGGPYLVYPSADLGGFEMY